MCVCVWFCVRVGCVTVSCDVAEPHRVCWIVHRCRRGRPAADAELERENARRLSERLDAEREESRRELAALKELLLVRAAVLVR